MGVVALADERIDLVAPGVLEGHLERRLGPVASAVEPGAVHRGQDARIGILVGDRRDHRAIEGEVDLRADVEDVQRTAIAPIDVGGALPDGPPVVVAPRGDGERLARAGSLEAVVAPGERDVSAHVAVVRLSDDLPRVALVANDHATSAMVRHQLSGLGRPRGG